MEINLEVLYPELKTMKTSEIFIEWAYIVKGFGLTQKIHLRRIIPKKELPAFNKAIKMVYGVGSNKEYFNEPDFPKLFECVDLVTIEK